MRQFMPPLYEEEMNKRFTDGAFLLFWPRIERGRAQPLR
jgi:hypothetical protein